MDTAPSAGAILEVMTFTQTDINVPVNDTIDTVHLKTDAVTTAKITDGNVTRAKIAADAIDATKLADGAVSEEHLDPTIISGLSAATPVSGDSIMFLDATDSALKKADVNEIMATAVSITSAADAVAMSFDVNENATFTGTVTATGTSVFANLDISGDVDIDGTTNLDVVDIDGAVDMASTLAVGGVVTANAGVVVDNITIDGTEIDLSSGDLTVDVAGNISLDADDGGHIRFKDGGTQYASIFKSGSGAIIDTPSGGDITLDSANDIILDAAGNDIIFKDAGTTFGQITNDSTNMIIYNAGSQMLKGLSSGSDAQFMGKLTVGSGSYTNSQYYAKDVVINAANEGGMTIASSANTHAAYIMFADGVSSGSEQYAGYIEYNHSANRFRVKSNGSFNVYNTTLGADAIRVEADGKIGLGNVSPDTAVHISTADRNIIKFHSSYGTARTYYFRNDSGVLNIGGGTPSDANDLLNLDVANDRVGVGTKTPTQALEVDGNVKSTRLILPNFFIGAVPSTANNNDGAALLVNLTNANANNVGFQFSGSIIANSYTGQAYLNVNIVKHYTTDAVTFDVSGDSHLSTFKTQLNLCTVTYNSTSYLAIVKNGGGTGTLSLNAYFQGWDPDDITEVTSSNYTITTNHGNLNF